MIKKSVYMLSALLFASCVSKKEVIYLQNLDAVLAETSEAMFSDPVITANDLLYISVSSFDIEAVVPFNLFMPARSSELRSIGTNNLEMQGYLVGVDGTIEFPVIGTLKVGGLKRLELIELLKEKISTYIKDPIINIKISNFHVTVLGEVMHPGTYLVPDERITLLEALGKAGDLTIYGKRDNIIIIREVEGVKTYGVVDITKADFLHSPFYFLQQNDVVYVEPNTARINSAAYSTNSSVYISIASVLISLVILFTK